MEHIVSEALRRAQVLQKEIRDILMREWDPIGVADAPEAQDEYDSYVGDIYGLLVRRGPSYKVIDYLWWAETEHMGLYGNRRRTEYVAMLLLQLVAPVAGNTDALNDKEGDDV